MLHWYCENETPGRGRHSCLVARDWPWHRAVVNELSRMSRSKACINICSYPPMGLAVKTILKDTYRLSWSISQAKSDTSEDIDIFADHWCFKHCFFHIMFYQRKLSAIKDLKSHTSEIHQRKRYQHITSAPYEMSLVKRTVRA